MRHITFLLFIVFSALLPARAIPADGRTWFIDNNSCSQTRMKQFVQKGMQGAFQLAQKALDVAQAAASDPNNNNDKLTLVVNLFGTAPYVDKFGTSRSPSEELVRIFTNILRWNNEGLVAPGDPPFTLGRGDIVCLTGLFHRRANIKPESILRSVSFEHWEG
jgi:hypothetical protein